MWPAVTSAKVTRGRWEVAGAGGGGGGSGVGGGGGGGGCGGVREDIVLKLILTFRLGRFKSRFKMTGGDYSLDHTVTCLLVTNHRVLD